MHRTPKPIPLTKAKVLFQKKVKFLLMHKMFMFVLPPKKAPVTYLLRPNDMQRMLKAFYLPGGSVVFRFIFKINFITSFYYT